MIQAGDHKSPFDHQELLALCKNDLSNQNLKRKIRGNGNIFLSISPELKKYIRDGLSTIPHFNEMWWEIELLISRDPVGVHNDRNVYDNDHTVVDDVLGEFNINGTLCDRGFIIPLEWDCRKPYTITYDKTYAKEKIIHRQGRYQNVAGNAIELDLTPELLINQHDYDLYFGDKSSGWANQLLGLRIDKAHEWRTDQVIVFESDRLHSSSNFRINGDSYKMSINGLGYKLPRKANIVASDTWCSMAWDHQFIDPTGRVKPCCRFAERARPKDNNLNEKSLEEIFYGPWMDGIRQKMMKGERIDGCIRCYQEEDSGKRSLRQRYHDNQDLPIRDLVNIDKPSLRWIELAISNDCNLACRMCDSRYAWKWFKEEQLIFGETVNTVERSKSDIANIYPFIDQLVHIKFTGGEPLLIKDQWTLVDKLLAERDCREIFLNYSTNCTIYPKESWIEKWSKFKKVEFALSFDSSNREESEYIRWPAKWETTKAVTERFIELKRSHGFLVFLRSTISILNVWYMPESMEWWYERDTDTNRVMNPTHLTYPNYLCLTALPYHIKERVTNRFNEYQKNSNIKQINDNLEYIKNFMNSKDDSHLLPELKRYLQATDENRGQNFFNSYPHFWDMFKDLK